MMLQAMRVAGWASRRGISAGRVAAHSTRFPTQATAGVRSLTMASNTLGTCPSFTARKYQAMNRQVLQRATTRGISTSGICNGTKIVSFNLADIGEAIAEVELVQWFVEVGDVVEQFDQVCLVESDKASTPITSRYDGKIVKLYYEEGDMAKTGLPLCDLEVDDEDLDETDDVLPEVDVEAPGAFSTDADHVVADNNTEVNVSNEKYIMTPAVRRIVKENNVDLAKVSPTGKNNRVLKEDVIRFLENGPQPSSPQSSSASPSPSPSPPISPVFSTPTSPLPPMRTLEQLKEDQVVPIKGMQKSMVKSMNAANKIPHFGYYDECVVDGLVKIRTELKGAAADRGIKLSYMPFMIKAVSLALNEFPILNATVNEECDAITYKAAHNIALAMDTPQGLIVPNVKNCEQKSIFEIAADLNQLQTLGAQGLLTVEHISGGTFSLSNIGVIGGTYASPLILVPQVAIGALGSVRKLPRYDENDNLVPRQIMEVSWSADHRVIDGVTMAQFSNKWKSYLENPSLMLSDLR